MVIRRYSISSPLIACKQDIKPEYTTTLLQSDRCGLSSNAAVIWETVGGWLSNHSGNHYTDVIMSEVASKITSLTIVYSNVYSGTDQRKHQSSASLAFVRGIHRWPVNSPPKGPVTQKMFPFDDVIICRLMTATTLTRSFWNHQCRFYHEILEFPDTHWI